MSERTYGFTKSGKPIDDEMIQELADEAERGYRSGQLEGHRRGPGRPPLGDAAKSVESVRLDPDLQVETIRKAVAEGVTVSELIRRALRQYLRSGRRPDHDLTLSRERDRSMRAKGGEVQMATSKSDASKAAKLLANPKTPKAVKSVAASDLAQTKGAKKSTKKK